ncbi:MAG: hypothetical protein Kow0022_00610 [Phycisphaerales bacterium]
MPRKLVERGASTTGLVIASLVACAGVCLVLFFVMTGGTRPVGHAGQGGDFGDVPDIRTILDEAESGGNVTLQYADRDDPSRLAAELKADEFRPAQENGRVEPNVYALRGVRARVFLKSGQIVLVEAERGRFFMPDRNAGPQSGSLDGHPRITLFPVEGEQFDPVLIAEFDEELRFNFNYAHVETPGRLKVTGREIEFVGHHVMARLNQRQQRIDELEVERGEYVRYTPQGASDAHRTGMEQERTSHAVRDAGWSTGALHSKRLEEGNAAGRSQQPGHADGSVQADQNSSHTAVYLATFQEGVRVTQGDRVLQADMLETWVRLIDHKLPERTRFHRSAAGSGSWIGPLVGSAAAAMQQAEQTQAPAQAQEPGESVVGRLEPVRSDELPVTLEWTGKLRLVPLVRSQPEQLASDDLYLRFTAVEAGLVRFEEGPSSGHAASVEYAATRRQLGLTGPGGSVRLASEGKGWIESSRAVVHMDTGQASVIGPGQVFDAGHRPVGPDAHEKYVKWLDRADFAFELDGQNRMTGQIREATFTGQARAVDDRRRAEGDMIIARFVPGRSGSPLISELEVYQANVSDGDGGSISARRLVVPFETSASRRHDPSHVIASGDVYVGKNGRSLTAQSLSARLVRGPDDAWTATDVKAERQVHYVEGDSIAAEADRLEASGLDHLAVLVGTESEPARVDYGDSYVTGPRIEMQDHPQRGAVVGAGYFASQDTSGTMNASWQDGLVFDRNTGVLELTGQARVEQLLSEGRSRVAEGDYLIVEMRSGSDEEMSLDAASIFGTDEQPAVVEMRLEGDEQAETAQMLHVEASELLAVDAGNGLVAPGPGRMVVFDRRDGSEQGLEGWDRGHALLTWHESLFVDRRYGEASLRGDAQVIHRALASGRTAELAADVVMARFVEVEGDQPEITMIEAAGTAYARVDQQEVLAARLLFDTRRQLIYAIGTDAEPVRSFDGATGSVLSARTLTWDLATDRIEIDRPSPFVAPRQP